jgi:putative chitinase
MIEIAGYMLRTMIPTCKSIDPWLQPLNTILPKYEINTKQRIAAFIAQCAHESGDFNVLEENLFYSAQGLLKVFPKYFNEMTADACAKKPALIANKVYGGRMGNGPEDTGDGYKYRGRGLIQLTGKANYMAFSHDVFGDESILANPDYVKTQEGALSSACWFWKKNGLNAIADTEDMVKLTKKINGGTHGLDDRTLKYIRIMNAL